MNGKISTSVKGVRHLDCEGFVYDFYKKEVIFCGPPNSSKHIISHNSLNPIDRLALMDWM
ncbi:hypothetical protein Mgra_00007178 [Meloidogyne graminicola]|uniref:Uncharacterized protein n=1 Tax=Meloidogyne graminicola TaxID=189291 RepID=A0A8S9ZJ54_9BILA|nr:hypothetical protein Mgra_00007178 [Meloidogyne graminicola]